MRTLGLAILLLLGGLGCGTPTASPPTPSFVLIDGRNREVRLTGPAKRVVSLTPAVTETLFAIDAGDFVAGVTQFCDFPPEAKSKPVVGGYAPNSINLELIAAAQPDLVIIDALLHVGLIEPIEQLNVPVVAISSDSIADVLAGMEILGQATGRTAQATELVSRLRKEMADVKASRQGKPRVRTMFLAWSQPLIVAGPKTFLSELIELAGGENVFADLTVGGYPKVSEEAMLERSPSVLLCARPPEFPAGSVWERVPAIRDKRVQILDENLISRPGPRFVESIRKIADALGY